MLAKTALLCMVAAITSVASGTADATTAFDGSWALTIYTRRGDCDPTYNFQINIRNGIVSHPNLVLLRGRVTAEGAVKVSVAVPGKLAAGSGRLSRNSGAAAGPATPNARCSGIW